MRATRWLAQNPALALGASTALLFATVRLPTELFYSRFGVHPEEVGLNSVQVLLQGSSFVLVLSLFVGVVYGIITLAFILIYLELLPTVFMPRGRQTGRGPFAPRVKTAFRRSARLAPIVVPVFSLGFAAAILTTSAIQDANAVEDGRYVSAEFMPWRAESAEVTWTRRASPQSLPTCGLYYLGEGDGQVIIFESRRDRTYRLSSKEVQVHWPDPCRWKRFPDE